MLLYSKIRNAINYFSGKLGQTKKNYCCVNRTQYKKIIKLELKCVI